MVSNKKNMQIIFQSSIQNGLGMVLGFILAFFNTIILTRNFTLSEYGVYGFVLLISDFVFIISVLGLNEGVTKFISSSKESSIRKKILPVFRASLNILIPFALLCSLFIYFQSNP